MSRRCSRRHSIVKDEYIPETWKNRNMFTFRAGGTFTSRYTERELQMTWKFARRSLKTLFRVHSQVIWPFLSAQISQVWGSSWNEIQPRIGSEILSTEGTKAEYRPWRQSTGARAPHNRYSLADSPSQLTLETFLKVRKCRRPSRENTRRFKIFVTLHYA